MALTKAIFDELCNTTYYVVVIDDVMRGQYDYSGLYAIDVSSKVADEFEIARSKVTRNKFEEMVDNFDFGAGYWEWMHLANTDVASFLQQLNTQNVVDLAARNVAEGFDESGLLYIAGKDLSDVYNAAIEVLQKQEQTAFVQTAIAQMQRKELGFIG
jgi:hypothetical protein